MAGVKVPANALLVDMVIYNIQVSIETDRTSHNITAVSYLKELILKDAAAFMYDALLGPEGVQ